MTLKSGWCLSNHHADGEYEFSHPCPIQGKNPDEKPYCSCDCHHGWVKAEPKVIESDSDGETTSDDDSKEQNNE